MNRDIVRCVGWFFYMVFTTLTVWGNGSIFFASSSHEAFLFSATRLFVFAATLLFAAVIAKNTTLIHSPNILCASTIVLLVLSFVLRWLPFSVDVVALVLAIFLGIAAGLLFLAWQQDLSQAGSYRACNIFTIGSGAAPLFILFLGFFSIESCELFPIACCLLSCVLYWVSGRMENQTIIPTKFPKLRKFPLEFWHQVICVATFAFVWEFILALGNRIYNSNEIMQILAWAQILASIVLVTIWLASKGRFGIGKLFTVSFPIAATSFLLLPFLGSVFQTILVCFVTILFAIASVLMQIACIREYEEHDIDPIYCFGIFAGIVYSFMAAGMLLGTLLFSMGELGVTQLLAVALALLWGFSLIAFLVRNHGKNTESVTTGQEGVLKQSSVTKENDNDVDSSQSINVACDYIIKSRGLSERETDVFLLLAKGRNLPYISEVLYISKNTVRTHLKSIYQKLDVHSRQELLDLIEKIAEDELIDLADC